MSSACLNGRLGRALSADTDSAGVSSHGTGQSQHRGPSCQRWRPHEGEMLATGHGDCQVFDNPAARGVFFELIDLK